ncbi:MAG: metallophosphoesterase family protein, partial [Humidesulfovibrio sp.]|nr:metallophosphoesterase family protein [Humidesulfovibrio sp.]
MVQQVQAQSKQPVAVISDVHGNLEALKAVLADIDAQGAGTILNLGDMVGYGPEPEACVTLLRARGVPTVLGNHEYGLAEAQARGFFNPQARKALDRTRELLSDDSVMYFRTLPRTLEAFG